MATEDRAAQIPEIELREDVNTPGDRPGAAEYAAVRREAIPEFEVSHKSMVVKIVLTHQMSDSDLTHFFGVVRLSIPEARMTEADY